MFSSGLRQTESAMRSKFQNCRGQASLHFQTVTVLTRTLDISDVPNSESSLECQIFAYDREFHGILCSLIYEPSTLCFKTRQIRRSMLVQLARKPLSQIKSPHCYGGTISEKLEGVLLPSAKAPISLFRLFNGSWLTVSPFYFSVSEFP